MDILLVVISDLTSPVHVVIDFESDINVQRQVFPNGLIIGATTVVTTTGSLSVFYRVAATRNSRKEHEFMHTFIMDLVAAKIS